MNFQAQTSLPDGRNVVADSTKAASDALKNGFDHFTVRSAERIRDGFWTKGENVVIEYFGKTTGNGDPFSAVYEPTRVYP